MAGPPRCEFTSLQQPPNSPNLGVVMRSVFGVGKPRVLQGAGGGIFAFVLLLWTGLGRWVRRVVRPRGEVNER